MWGVLQLKRITSDVLAATLCTLKVGSDYLAFLSKVETAWGWIAPDTSGAQRPHGHMTDDLLVANFLLE